MVALTWKQSRRQQGMHATKGKNCSEHENRWQAAELTQKRKLM